MPSLIYSFYLYTTIRPIIRVHIDLFSYLHTTIRPNYRVLFHFYFFSARPFDQKLGSSLIYIFHLHTTIRQNIWPSFSHLFFLCARPFDQKLVSSLIYFFCLYMTIRPKSWVTLILKFIIKSYPYISYTVFMEVLLLYFVRYIHGCMKSLPCFPIIHHNSIFSTHVRRVLLFK